MKSIAHAPHKIKAVFAMVIIQLAVGVTLIILSAFVQPFSIQAAITDGNILTITYWQSIFFNFSLAAGLATVAVNILGLLACIFWSHEKVYYALLTVVSF